MQARARLLVLRAPQLVQAASCVVTTALVLVVVTLTGKLKANKEAT